MCKNVLPEVSPEQGDYLAILDPLGQDLLIGEVGQFGLKRIDVSFDVD